MQRFMLFLKINDFYLGQCQHEVADTFAFFLIISLMAKSKLSAPFTQCAVTQNWKVW